MGMVDTIDHTQSQGRAHCPHHTPQPGGQSGQLDNEHSCGQTNEVGGYPGPRLVIQHIKVSVDLKTLVKDNRNGISLVW